MKEEETLSFIYHQINDLIDGMLKVMDERDFWNNTSKQNKVVEMGRSLKVLTEKRNNKLKPKQ